MNILKWFIDNIVMGGLFVMYANHRGNEGVLVIGTSAMAELRGWEYNEEAAEIEDTILSDTWRTRQAGNRSWAGSAQAWWDETDTNGQEVCTIGASVTVKFYMEGTGTNATYKLGTAIITGVRQSAAINGMVEKTLTLAGNGALTQTTV